MKLNHSGQETSLEVDSGYTHRYGLLRHYTSASIPTVLGRNSGHAYLEV